MLIIGCGDIGQRVARLYLGGGEVVRGLVRSAARAITLNQAGILAVQMDLDQEPLPTLTRRGERVLYLAPPPDQGSGDTRLRRVLAAMERDGQPRRLVYMSTSGVYGDCRGAWVDESQPPRPGEERSRRRLDAEQQVRAWGQAGGGEFVILRVGGIYGPARLPLARLRQRLPMVREEDAPFTNRIHEDDLSRVCMAALEAPVAGEVFNISDGHPGTMAEYFDRVADLAGLPHPPKISMAEANEQLSPALLSYLRESRRLDTQKMRGRLGVELRYPTLEEGLAACFAGV